MNENRLNYVNWRNVFLLMVGIFLTLYLTVALFIKLEEANVSFDPSMVLIISVFLIQDIFWLVIIAIKIMAKWTVKTTIVSFALVLYLFFASLIAFSYVTLNFILS